MSSGSDVFARTLIALQPYAAEIVFIGGWVHALYLAEANSAQRPVFTEDIDVTIPHQLLMYDRPALLDLATAAGYAVHEIAQDSRILDVFHPGPQGSIVELDLLTQAADPRQAIRIEGQPDLVVQGYPDQHILLENSRWLEVGRDISDLLEPPVRIRVPTIAAYAFGKGLSSETRTNLSKRAKDFVYLLEIARHPGLGDQVREGLPDLAGRYPNEWNRWRHSLEGAIEDNRLLEEIGDQLIAGTRIIGPENQVLATIRARLRRILGETTFTT